MFDITKTKAVLWDLDDTLYSRVTAARHTFYGMFRELLYPGGSDALIAETVDYMMTQVKRNSMVHEEAFRALLKKHPPAKPYIRSDCLDYYYAHISEFAQPFPEQMAVLKKLREAGIKTALVSNVAPDRIYAQRQKIQALKIAPLFDAIVLSGKLGIHKPDRRIFDHAAKLLGIPNSQCVFVGDDSVSDISGALNAGMEAVWINQWADDNCFAQDPRVCCVTSVLEYFAL